MNGFDEMAHGSSGLLLGAANECPIDIRAKRLAAHFAAGQALDCWANISRQFSLAVAPEANSLGGNAKLSGHRGWSANYRNCLLNWFHIANSTLVDIQVQQVYLVDFSTDV